MKMDFVQFAEANPARRQSERYAALVARATNRALVPADVPEEPRLPGKKQKRFAGLEARIAFFASARQNGNEQIYGAFLPEEENNVLVSANSKNDVNLSSSMNGKPSFLGSRYPGVSGHVAGHGKLRNI